MTGPLDGVPLIEPMEIGARICIKKAGFKVKNPSLLTNSAN